MMPKRVRMKMGKQKEMIENAKSIVGDWEKLSKLIGANKQYLRYYLRREARTLPEPLYNKLSKIVRTEYDGFILEMLDGNWGRMKGAKMSPRTKPKSVSLIKPSVELAEIMGIMLGDGNIYKKQYAIRVCGNAKEDKIYLIEHVKKLFDSVFGIIPREYYLKSQNELILYAYSKFIATNLMHYGLVSGNKKKKGAKIPEWIMNDEKYTSACIRGLFDTDGTVFQQRGNLKIELASGIPSLQKTFYESMKRVGFHKNWSTPNSSNVSRYGLYSKNDVNKFIDEIGFKNIKHINKCTKYNRAKCPGSVAA